MSNQKRRAAQELLRLSAEIEIQLQQKVGGAPLAHHLKRMRQRHQIAMAALADVDATKADEIRKHQMAVRMHDLLLDDLSEIVAMGNEAASYLDSSESADIAEAIGLNQGEEGTTPATEDYND